MANAEFDDDRPPEFFEEADDRGPAKGGKNSSKRVFVLILGVVGFAILGGVWVVMSALHANRVGAGAKLGPQPAANQNPNGVGADPNYQRVVQASNKEGAQKALQVGGSFIPTLNGSVGSDSCADDTKTKDALAAANAKNAADEARISDMAQKIEEQQQRLAAMQANRGGGNGTPDRYMYHGHLYLSSKGEEDRFNGINGQMSALATSLGGVNPKPYVGHSFAQVSVSSSGSAGGVKTQTNAVLNAETAATSAAQSSGVVLIPAAATRYATLDMTANSDVPGPIMATVQEGKYAGARALGKFAVKNDYLVMEFTSMTTKDGVTFPIDAIGVNPGTQMTGMADDVDNHYLVKFGAIFGAAFLQGFGNAMLQSGTTTITPTSTVATKALSTKDASLAALGRVGQTASQLLMPYAQKPATVIKYANTGLVLLFLSPVKSK